MVLACVRSLFLKQMLTFSKLSFIVILQFFLLIIMAVWNIKQTIMKNYNIQSCQWMACYQKLGKSWASLLFECPLTFSVRFSKHVRLSQSAPSWMLQNIKESENIKVMPLWGVTELSVIGDKFNSLIHFRPMFHLCRNQVVSFY